MELTKEQQTRLDAWLKSTLARVNSTEMLGCLLSKLNEQRLSLMLRNDPAELAFLDAMFKAARERFLDIAPDHAGYYIEPATAKTMVAKMLDANEPHEPILELLNGAEPFAAMVLRRELKKTFFETRNESVRFRMEYFNQVLKNISSNTAMMHKGNLMSAPTHFSLTSTVRQQQSAQVHNELNDQLLRGIRKL